MQILAALAVLTSAGLYPPETKAGSYLSWVASTPRFETSFSVTVLDEFQRRPADRPTGTLVFERPDKVAYRLGLRGDIHELYSDGNVWIETDHLARTYFVTPTPSRGLPIFPFQSALTELRFAFPDFMVHPDTLNIIATEPVGDWHPATITLFDRPFRGRVRLYPDGAPRTVEATGLMTWDFGPYRYPVKLEAARWTTDLPSGFTPQQHAVQPMPPLPGQTIAFRTVQNLRTGKPTNLRMATGRVLLVRVFDSESDLARASDMLQAALQKDLAKDKVTLIDLHLRKPKKSAPLSGVGSFVLGVADARALEPIGTPQWWVVSPDGTLYQLFIGIDQRQPLQNRKEIVDTVREALNAKPN